jgi:TPR repeat protein
VAGPQKAADEGNDVAQCLLGVRYGAGDHAPQDYAEAAKWFRRAADRGNACAQSRLALLYTLR